MARPLQLSSLVVVVGAGGVGKTTLAAALAVLAARQRRRTLVMTFDPSLRLKDALGVGEEARERPVTVLGVAGGFLEASLLDAGRTFDRLVARYAPDQETLDRILGNRFYRHLSGSLAGVLEYMAVERLFEVASDGAFDVVVLDTPPTRQALDFLHAPERVIGFLDSGALRIALKPWFDAQGRLRATRRLGGIGRGLEQFLDRVVGLELLRDMAEFFQAFGPLYGGFRARAAEVQSLLRRAGTSFLLVSGPGEARVGDTMFMARRLDEAGYGLAGVVVNQVHPAWLSGAVDGGRAEAEDAGDGRALLAWLARRDARGVAALRGLIGASYPLVEVPLLLPPPSDLAGVGRLADSFVDSAGNPFEANLPGRFESDGT